MNAIKSAAVCSSIETTLIFYINEIEEDPKDPSPGWSELQEAELCKKFDNEYLSTVSASLNTFKCIRCAKTKRPALKKKN